MMSMSSEWILQKDTQLLATPRLQKFRILSRVTKFSMFYLLIDIEVVVFSRPIHQD